MSQRPRAARAALAAVGVLALLCTVAAPAAADRLRKRLTRPVNGVEGWCGLTLVDDPFSPASETVTITFLAQLDAEQVENFAVDNIVVVERQTALDFFSDLNIPELAQFPCEAPPFDFTAVDPATIGLREIFPGGTSASWVGIDDDRVFYDDTRSAPLPADTPSGSLALGREGLGAVALQAGVTARGLDPETAYVLSFSWYAENFTEESEAYLDVIVDPLSFHSGFEDPFCDEWSDRLPANDCQELVGSLAAGESAVSHRDGYRAEAPGEHRAILDGSGEGGLELALTEWSGSAWVRVAQDGGGSRPQIRYQGPAGRYRWQVTAARGGAFRLRTSYAPAAGAAVNDLRRTRARRQSGEFALEALFARGSNARDCLVSRHPESADVYRTSFMLYAGEDLFLKGKHEILSFSHGRRPFLKLLLRAKKPTASSVILQLRIDDGAGRFRKAGEVKLLRGVWRRVNVEWLPAPGPGRRGGFVFLFTGTERGKGRRFRGHEQRLDEVCLGHVGGGRKRTEGSVYFDDFRSRWEE